MFSLDFPYAYGSPLVHANFRSEIDDFEVVEDLGFEPNGDGEHIFLKITKRGQNTQWVAQQIASFAGVKGQDVGYCGLKDRHAATQQWFSVYDPKRKLLDWSQMTIAGVSVDTVSRHHKKLKPGQHRSNHFAITLKNFRLADGTTIDASELHNILIPRLQLIANAVPNYFGEQRFGHDGNNLQQAEQWFSQANGGRVGSNLNGRTSRSSHVEHKQRGLIISAARSYLFNQVLAARVEELTWNTTKDASRVDSGPLWGRGRSLVAGLDLEFESRVLQPWNHWCEALEHVGLQQERRALVLTPQNFRYQFDAAGLCVQFNLPPGQFATSVLREICQLNNQQNKEQKQQLENEVNLD